jgi:hypothetical protein
MYRHVPPQHPRRPNKKNFQFILDQFTHSDIKRWGDIKDLYLRYHWEFYSELAFQRSKISDEIKNSLLEASIKTFTFTRWQRVIKHQYSVEPLSIVGDHQTATNSNHVAVMVATALGGLMVLKDALSPYFSPLVDHTIF